MNKNKFIIVGGGISGLTLAYELCKAGCQVTLYEKNKYIGGLASTLKFNNFSIDTGPHIFHSAHKEIVEYWRALVGKKLVKKNFFSGNFQNKKIYDYPINKETFKSQYTNKEQKLIDHDLSNVKIENISKSKNYYEYVRALAGNFLAEKFFTKYPKKLWGLDTKNLSARFAPRRIEIRDQIRPFHSGPGRFAGAIDGGCGVLAKALQVQIKKLGGKIKFGYTLNKIEYEKTSNTNKVNSIIFENKEEINVQDKTLISTLPITKHANLFNIPTSLYFRSILLVNIILKGKDPLPKNYDWLYFDDEKVPFHRIGVQNRFSKLGIPKDHIVLCCEIAYDQKLTKKNKEFFEEKTLNSLKNLDLIQSDDYVTTITVDVGDVYPGYYFGHEKELSEINAKLGAFSNFYTIGSLAEYSYTDLQVITAKAIDLAKELSTLDLKNKSEILKTQVSGKPLNRFKFGDVFVSDSKDDQVFLIGEIGLSHNGNVENCKKLISAAAKAGFNSAKIQTYDEGRISKKTRTSRYFEESLEQEESISDFLDKIIFSKQELIEIFDYSKKCNIELFSTPFDKNSVDLLETLNVSGYKVSSMDIINHPLIDYISKKGKPIILSTGMAKLGDIETAIEICLKNSNNKIAVLHCVSSYPCPLEYINLSRITEITETFKVIGGLSDHTVEIETPSLAVVGGARIVEKHITLDKGMDGPDHNFSLTPNEMNKMVSLVRKTELALKNNEQSSPAELSSKQNLRRSIYAAFDLKPGDVITEENLAIKSPGDGIPVKYFDILIGKRIISEVKKDFPLTWSNFFNE